MIRVLDSYAAMEGMLLHPFSLDAWKAYACGISPSAAEKCLSDIAEYDFAAECLPVLNGALNDPSGLKEAHDSFLFAAAGIDRKVKECLCFEVTADLVFMLGLCNGAGWATELDGRPAVLIGAEKVLELGWQKKERMASLLCHELGHLWHAQARRTPDFRETEPALWQLYCEGVAMVAEQEMQNDPLYFHQYGREWRDWCGAHLAQLAGEYLLRIRSKADVREFFGDWNSLWGFSDTGYYLGASVVRSCFGAGGHRRLCDLSEEEFLAALQSLCLQGRG